MPGKLNISTCFLTEEAPDLARVVSFWMLMDQDQNSGEQKIIAPGISDHHLLK
jgi:hypothetical protein